MPICKKCQSAFPNRLKFNEKFVNLQNRKFCPNCSPIGLHNTKPDNPSRKAVYGQKNYKKLPYSQWSNKNKESNRRNSFLRSVSLKNKLVDLFGGKCQICNYVGFNWSMTFHHLSDKEFPLTSTNLRSHSWSEILIEANKCQLLCVNCHMELEDKTIALKGIQRQRGEIKKNIIITEKGGKCKLCNYNKSIRCMSFHHLNPKEKSFPLDIRSFNAYNLDKLRTEADKCDLLCLNCHCNLENTLRKSRHCGV